MKSLLLCLLCALAASAEPVATRDDGQLGNLPVAPVGREAKGRVVPLKGHYFQGEVELRNGMDLRDCRQLHVAVRLKNVSSTKAFFAVYVVVVDSQGKVLGAEGYQENTFAQEPGKSIRHDVDVAMPNAQNQGAASFQVILYEDTQRM